MQAVIHKKSDTWYNQVSPYLYALRLLHGVATGDQQHATLCGK